MGELGGRGHEPLERLIQQIKSQPKVSFETYFPPKEREIVPAWKRRAELSVAIFVSAIMWAAITYAIAGHFR